MCAGYAKLLEALGKAAGEEIIYVIGDARTQTSDLSGQGHAWNAAKVKGQWYLIDATWDSGYVDRSSGFTKNYRTEYLMPPPEVMVISHFPKDPAWQLLSNPLPLGEFLRQPMMKPKFFADGLQLVSPVRSPRVGLENRLLTCTTTYLTYIEDVFVNYPTQFNSSYECDRHSSAFTSVQVVSIREETSAKYQHHK